jgi:hypothetical protein
VRGEARCVDGEPERQAALEQAVEGTRRLRLDALAAAPAAADADSADGAAWLADDRGARFRLEPEAGLVRIGRATDNDLAIDHQRVSRYHAHVRRVAASWLVYDLESTNGTYVDGQRLAADRPLALHPGSVLRLGDYDLRVLGDRG